MDGGHKMRRTLTPGTSRLHVVVRFVNKSTLVEVGKRSCFRLNVSKNKSNTLSVYLRLATHVNS